VFHHDSQKPLQRNLHRAFLLYDRILKKIPFYSFSGKPEIRHIFKIGITKIKFRLIHNLHFMLLQSDFVLAIYLTQIMHKPQYWKTEKSSFGNGSTGETPMKNKRQHSGKRK
jgi:hypothetical protein